MGKWRGIGDVTGVPPPWIGSSLPGVTRQSIFVAKNFLRRTMDPRVKPYEIHTFRRAHPCLIAWKRVSPWSMTTGPGFP